MSTQDTNQNTNTNPKNETTNNERPETTNGNQPGDSSFEESPGVVKGALQNAVMRTFRGDVTKNASSQEASSVLKNMAPKKKANPASPTPQPNTNARTLPEQGTQKKNKAVVHTFKDDIQNLVRDQKMSMTRIAAIQSDNGRGAPEQTNTSSTRKTTTTVAVIVLAIAIVAMLALGTFYAYKLNTTTSPTIEFEPAFIFTEARERLDITDKDARSILTTLASLRRDAAISLGSVVEIYLTRNTENGDGESIQTHLDSLDLLQALNAQLPNAFIQTLNLDYVLGIHVIDENVPFLILRTQSYGHAYSGMLAWERNIEEDLLPFFSPNATYIKPAIAEDENMFVDSVIQNIDVRILRDKDGITRMLYAFLDRGTVVITTDTRTLLELASRLRVADI